jgi:hypothetical protein
MTMANGLGNLKATYTLLVLFTKKERDFSGHRSIGSDVDFIAILTFASILYFFVIFIKYFLLLLYI